MREMPDPSAGAAGQGSGKSGAPSNHVTTPDGPTMTFGAGGFPRRASRSAGAYKGHRGDAMGLLGGFGSDKTPKRTRRAIWMSWKVLWAPLSSGFHRPPVSLGRP